MPAPSSERPKPIESQKLRKGVKLGINVLDIMRVNPHVRIRALRDESGNSKLDLEKIHKFADGEDERFAEFTCELLSAALAIDIVRNEGRVELSTIARAYIRKGETWYRLPYNAVLCRKATPDEGDGFVLNEEVFPIEIAPVPYSGGDGERILISKKERK